MNEGDKICRNCKHWVPDGWVEKVILGDSDKDIGGASGDCDVLLDILNLGDDVYMVSAPIDFGCNKWESKA